MKKSAYASMQTMQDGHWWWRGMAHLYCMALKATLESGITERAIIDVGCGFGANLSVLNQFGKVVGVDISLDALRSISQRPALGLVQARADALPFRANSFDVVALLAVVEHVEQDRCVLAESHRVAEHGAIQILLTSAFMLLWSHHDIANGHYRRYRAAALDQLQQAEGWHSFLTSYVTVSVFPLVAAARVLQRLLKTRVDADYDMGPESRLSNAIFERLLHAESSLIIQQRMRLPFGVDLFSIARRDD